MLISVAIPVRNGGKLLLDAVDAVRRQVLPDGIAYELIACDSGSRDGSVQALRERGVEVFTIAPAAFSHGATRNLLVERARGELIAFLTQDAVPAANDWLAQLAGPFSTATDVALSFGPYLPRPDASPMVRRELSAWFGRLSPDGSVRIDRLGEPERSGPVRALYGPRAYFTDANGCVARDAWRTVPFRPVAYAEDHALAIDMLRAGYAKAFVPGAAVVHSHDYSVAGWMRRSFDESRAINELYGQVAPASLGALAQELRGRVAADWRCSAAAGRPGPQLLARSLVHHSARLAGAALGSRADRLPVGVVQRLSLERRR